MAATILVSNYTIHFVYLIGRIGHPNIYNNVIKEHYTHCQQLVELGDHHSARIGGSGAHFTIQRTQHELPGNHPALVILDVFAAHCTQAVKKAFQNANIRTVYVPAGCTGTPSR